MWRHLYSLALTLAIPLLIGQGLNKSRAQQRPVQLASRLGLRSPQMPVDAIWIHACSLGEAKVGLALLQALRDRGDASSVWFTATTPSGQQVLADAGQPVAVFPWDLPWVWHRWLVRTRPRALVLIETELWPNLLAACGCAGIPVVLANGRLSARALTRYQRIGGLARPMWAGLSLAMMQCASDAKAAIALGVPRARVHVVGSLKLDQPLPLSDPLILDRLKAWKGARRCVVGVSTHPGEEWLFAQALGPHDVLCVVPRHPHRGSALAVELSACSAVGDAVVRMTDPGLGSARVLIGDTFGDMGSYLAIADVVLLGGSFVPHGGQNPIEPAALGKALIMGPSVFNFAEIAEGLLACGGALAATEDSLCAMIEEASANRAAMGRQAQAFVALHRGAGPRQAALLSECLRRSN